MTNQHSVTMLSDLIEQLESDIDRYEISTSQALARAYAAGADQQLELDAKWLDHNALNEAHLKIAPMGEVLKEAMRPKPPSLKETLLARVARIPGEGSDAAYLRHWVDNESQRLVDLLHEVFKSLPD